ncbi:MAG TPA: ABC transporter ATP-binding protein [Flavipsychrobacter sp.]|nr:ABC transporter ATP-binding protein [Flavipsychrobacter sp.]
MSQPLLSVKNLRLSFLQDHKETPPVVDALSFELQSGKVLAIVGESGSGKSLTALSIMGLLPKNALVKGTITCTILQKSFSYHAHKKEASLVACRGKEITMVFQEPMSALNPIMTVGKQLQECISAHQQLSDTASKQLAIEWLRKVKIPVPKKSFAKYPHEMSGGQKQRVMIAMALCNQPALLICDEPTTALDVTVQQEIIKLMQQLQTELKTSMIFITHDLTLAATIASDIMVLYKGKMVEYGTVQQVIHHPSHPYTKALLACRPSPNDKGYYLPTVQDYLNSDNEITKTQHTSSTQSKHAECLLKVSNLAIQFVQERNWLGKPTATYKAVDHISFDLPKSSVLGLVGESGCGKSTLSKSIMGLLPVQKGAILYEGKDLTKMSSQERKSLSSSIQMIFQDPYASLNPRLTIGALLMEPMQVHRIVPSHGLQKEAYRLLDLVQLPADAFHRYPHQFSGGQRQRIGIARALSVRPSLLICDESVSALDVSVQAQILNLLKELQSQLQLTYIFISHDLSVVQYISDTIMVMHQGKIVETGMATELLSHPTNEYTQKLVDAIPRL